MLYSWSVDDFVDQAVHSFTCNVQLYAYYTLIKLFCEVYQKFTHAHIYILAGKCVVWFKTFAVYVCFFPPEFSASFEIYPEIVVIG